MSSDFAAILAKSDEEILNEVFAQLSSRVHRDAYGDDSAYANEIGKLPSGLRAMAATHWLDISLTLDDIGWHFLNFGEPNLVRETEGGLRELGLDNLADWFREAHQIISSVQAVAEVSGDNYTDCLQAHGKMDRIDELSELAGSLNSKNPPPLDSAIYAAWVRYARAHPEQVFG